MWLENLYTTLFVTWNNNFWGHFHNQTFSFPKSPTISKSVYIHEKGVIKKMCSFSIYFYNLIKKNLLRIWTVYKKTRQKCVYLRLFWNISWFFFSSIFLDEKWNLIVQKTVTLCLASFEYPFHCGCYSRVQHFMRHWITTYFGRNRLGVPATGLGCLQLAIRELKIRYLY